MAAAGKCSQYPRSLASLWVLLSFSAALLITSCSRTVVGGYTDSPDKKYRIYGRVYGAFGRSFLASPTKTVRISIVRSTDNGALFEKEYRVKGFDVGWDAAWKGNEELTVVVFDYGPGVEFHGQKQDEPKRREIRTMTYYYDRTAEHFTERRGLFTTATDITTPPPAGGSPETHWESVSDLISTASFSMVQ
jgi:hypothetical protein